MDHPNKISSTNVRVNKEANQSPTENFETKNDKMENNENNERSWTTVRNRKTRRKHRNQYEFGKMNKNHEIEACEQINSFSLNSNITKPNTVKVGIAEETTIVVYNDERRFCHTINSGNVYKQPFTVLDAVISFNHDKLPEKILVTYRHTSNAAKCEKLANDLQSLDQNITVKAMHAPKLSTVPKVLKEEKR